MNKRLARFLTSLVENPDLLDAFNDPDRRASVLETADVSPEDKAALLTGESGAVLRQLAVKPGDVEWVVAPGVKKAAIAFGIKAFKTVFGSRGDHQLLRAGPQASPRRRARPSAQGSRSREEVQGLAWTRRRSARRSRQRRVRGTGFSLVVQTTREAQAEMERADKLFYLVSDPAEALWLHERNASAESLAHHYAEGKPRLESYESMVAQILSHVMRGERVCVALYGHPGVGCDPTHMIMRRAETEGFRARIQPGVSSDACLYADLASTRWRMASSHTRRACSCTDGHESTCGRHCSSGR